MSDVAELWESFFLKFYCPGCKETHVFPVKGPKAWTWNGSLTKPTCSPSISLTMSVAHPSWKCHFFIKDGKIQYCGDCSHELAGQTVFMVLEVNGG